MTFTGTVTQFEGGPQTRQLASVIPVTTTPSSNATVALGTIAINNATATAYMAVSRVSGVTTWALIASGAGGDVVSLTADDATVATPNAGTVTVSGGSTGLTTTASSSTLSLTGTLDVANGGTGAATLTGLLTGNGTSAVTANAVTQHGVLIGGASNAASSLGVAATGTVLAGSTGADPAFTASPSGLTAVTAASFYASGDGGGVASQTGLTNVKSTSISSGVGTILMTTANNANSSAWIKIYIGTSAYYIPCFTTDAP